MCFFLSALEYMIPKPLPFIRLGLANLPLLLALDIFPFSSYMLLVALKVCGQALVSGTLFSYVFLFSISGTGVSALLMYVLRRGLGTEKISLIGISVAGALASNGMTLTLAYFFVFGAGVRYAAAPVLALGIVTGTLLGLGGEYFIRRSKWYAAAGTRRRGPNGTSFPSGKEPENLQPALQSPADFPPVPDNASPANAQGGDGLDPAVTARKSKLENFRKTRESFYQKTFYSGELAIAGLCMMPALLLNPDTSARIVQFLFFFLLAWLAGKKNNLFIMVSVMSAIVLFNLLVPYGEILFSAGPFRITSGALMGGIRRAVTLEGLFMLSRFCVRKDLMLPGTFGELAGESLRIFSAAAEGKHFFTRRAAKPDAKTLVEDLDRLLISMDTAEGGNENAAGEKTETSGRCPESRKAGFMPRLILAAAMILAWLPFIIKA